jgi:zinc/manganese transport system substrate-binding protein
MAVPPIRRVGSLLALLLLPLGLLACRRQVGQVGGPLPVLATVAPVTLLAQGVAAGCARVEPLVSGGRDAHELQATPADLALLARARVLVINGLGLEPYVPRLLEAAANPRLRLVDSSRAVVPVRYLNRPDPHVWLDPRRAAVQVDAIRDGLAAADPACRARYGANAADLRRRLLALDRELATTLAPYRGALVVGPHVFLASFADRYGLRADGLVEQPEQRPSPGDLRRVGALLAAPGPRALVVEPGEAAAPIEALGRDLGLRPVPFDPMEAGFVIPAGAPAAPGPGGTAPAAAADPLGPYAAVLRANVRQLVGAFQASGPSRP